MLRLIYSQCIFSLKLCLLVCYQAQVKFERRVRVCQSFNEVDVTLNSKLKNIGFVIILDHCVPLAMYLL